MTPVVLLMCQIPDLGVLNLRPHCRPRVGSHSCHMHRARDLRETRILLQCRLFGHVVLGILHGLTYEKSGHKAHTYRQIEQYPDPKRRGPIAPEGFILLLIVDPFINKRINYQ